MIELDTARLILKAHTLANIEKMNAWNNDVELLYYDSDQSEDRQPETLDETREHLTRHINQPREDMLRLAIHKRTDDELIGFLVIAYIDLYHRRCRVGLTIGDKHEWGKGYAKEALTAVIDYCFETLGLNRISCEIYAMNARSLRLFESLGFHREGVLRQNVWKRGQFVDELVYGLLCEEWRKQR